jgi:hypothetical protein
MKLLQVDLISDFQLVDVDFMVPMLINLKFCYRFLPILVPAQHQKFDDPTPSITAIDHHHNKPNKKLQLQLQLHLPLDVVFHNI